DAVTAGLFMKPERCAAVAYSEPILCDAEALLVKKGNPKGFRSYEDIAADDSATVGAPGGGTEEKLALQAGVPRNRVIVVPDGQSGLKMLQDGRIDAYSLPVLSINDLVKKANDPNLEVVAGESVPKELVYGQRMSEWLHKLYPNPSDSLQIAARAQHIRRWDIPRADYPMDRKGYKDWRTALGKYHAEVVARLMRESGYEPETVERVEFIVRKRKLKADAEVQALEDVICLVFLQYYFGEFAAKHPDDKVVDILRKTWAKMSPVGHAAALELPLEGRAAQLVGAALAG
ncbi:MAG: DUF4202 family protein, partial [Myxococcales bacterium]|nr:DUF4202 family protein [Myxococcales bacterium]